MKQIKHFLKVTDLTIEQLGNTLEVAAAMKNGEEVEKKEPRLELLGLTWVCASKYLVFFTLCPSSSSSSPYPSSCYGLALLCWS